MDALIVKDEEAVSLARELAERRRISVAQAVVEALRGSLARTEPSERPDPKPIRLIPLEDLTPEQRADYEAMRALALEAQAYIIPGATSDHSDMYDENGLPI